MAQMSGRSALDAIHKAIKEEQARVRQLDADLARVNDELVRIDAQRNKEHRELARVRIGFLAGSDIVARTDEADRQVLALLARRQAALESVRVALDGAESERESLEAKRAEQADALEAAATAIDEAEAAVQERLKSDAAYLAQAQTARNAERVAVHADEKATQSEQELESKGASYRADKLFMYLYQRGFGTSEYRARGLVRWLDGRVAKVIAYEGARLNYSRLLELPVRLREHADYVGAQADEEFAKLAALDAQARVDAGIPRLEEAAAASEKRLAAVDEQIAAAAEAYQTKLKEAERFAVGEDEEFQKAVAFLSSEFGRDDVAALRREALATPFPDDDVVVARLLDLEAERSRQAASLAELKQTAEANRKRVSELEQVRREFTQRQYDAPGTSFSNGAMIASVIAQLVMGALSHDSFWRVLQQQRRYQPQRTDPTFGSGGFGRGTMWGGAGKVGRDIGGEIIGEVLGGLLGGLARSGSGSSSRTTGGSGGAFGGTSRARSSGGGTKTGSGSGRSTSKPSSTRSSGGGGRRGGFKTGGRF